MMVDKVNLEECTPISNEDWCNLVKPIFVGQTRVVDNIYYMVWLCNGIYYKTTNYAIPQELYNKLHR